MTIDKDVVTVELFKGLFHISDSSGFRADVDYEVLVLQSVCWELAGGLLKQVKNT